MRSWHIKILFMKCPEKNGNNSFDPRVWFYYFAGTLATSSNIHSMCTLSFSQTSFLFTSCMPVACSAAHEHWCGLWRSRLSLPVTSKNLISLQDSLTDPTFCSNALKCIYIMAARCCLFLFPSFSLLPVFIFLHLSSLMHFFPLVFFFSSLWLSLPFLWLLIYLCTLLLL